MSDPIRFDNNIIVNGDSQPSTGPSTGTLIVNGGVTINNTTEATSSTSGGALTIAGGIACAKDFVSGGTVTSEYITVTNNITIGGNITATGTITSVGESQPSSINTPGIISSTLASGTGLSIAANAVIAGSVSPGTIIGSPACTLGTVSTGALTPGSIVGSPTCTLGTVSTGSLSSTSLSLSGGLTASGVAAFNSYQELTSITAPGNASSSSKINLYLDSADLLLKSKNNTGVVTTFSPSTTKGDLIVHNGTTQARLPAPVSNNYILKTDSAAGTGLDWGPSVSISSSDTGSAFFEQYDGIGSQEIGVFPVWTDMQFNVDRVINSDYYSHDQTEGIVTFLQASQYVTLYRVAVTSTTSNVAVQTRVMIDKDTGIFEELPGSRGGVFCGSTGERAAQTECDICLDVGVNWRLKVQVSEITSTGNVRTVADSSLISIIRFFVKNVAEDTSSFISTYNDTSDITLSGSFQDIPMDDVYLTNAKFTYTPGDSEITINAPGGYYTLGRYAFQNTSASDNVTQVQVQLLADYGGGYTLVTGSTTNCAVSKAAGTVGYQSGIAFGLVACPPGTKVKMQAKIVSGGGTISTLPNGNNLTIINPTTSDLSFTVEPGGFKNTVTFTQILGSYTDIQLDADDGFTDTGFFTHTPPNAHITIGGDGMYNLIGVVNFKNNNSNPGTVRMRFMVDNNDGNGFNYVGGSTSIVDISPDLIVYCQCSMFYFIPQGGKIKMQAKVSSGTPDITIETASLSMARVNELIPPIEGVHAFGSNAQYQKSPHMYATSGEATVAAYQCATNYINAGVYIIQWYYQVKNIGGMAIKLYVDSVEINNDTLNVATESFTGKSGVYVGVLNQGIHQIQIGINSLTEGSECVLTLPKILLYRMS